MHILKKVEFVKNSRRTAIWIEIDSFHYVLVRRRLGKLGTKRGRIISEICDNVAEANEKFAALCQYRLQKRRYQQI